MASRGKKKKTRKQSEVTKQFQKLLPTGRLFENEMLAVEDSNRTLSYQVWYASDIQGCGYYRCYFPAIASHHWGKHPKYSLNICHPHRIVYDENFMKYTDLVMLQRWDSLHHIRGFNFMTQCKSRGAKFRIVYDIDDDIYSLPDFNYFKKQGFGKQLKMIEDIMSHCAAIIVSTQQLKDIFQYKVDRPCYIVPNYLPRFLWGEAKWVGPNDDKKMNILWAGSGTHFSDDNKGDFEKLGDLIKRSRDKYRWIFFGAIPKDWKGEPNVSFIPWRNMWELPMVYKSIKADIAIAPLKDHFFNYSKSDIKAKEYIAAGIPGLYADMEPYKKLSCKFNSIEEVEKLLSFYYNNIDERKKLYEKDLETYKNDLWLEEKINDRINLFIDIMEGKK